MSSLCVVPLKKALGEQRVKDHKNLCPALKWESEAPRAELESSIISSYLFCSTERGTVYLYLGQGRDIWNGFEQLLKERLCRACSKLSCVNIQKFIEILFFCRESVFRGMSEYWESCHFGAQRCISRIPSCGVVTDPPTVICFSFLWGCTTTIYRRRL